MIERNGKCRQYTHVITKTYMCGRFAYFGNGFLGSESLCLPLPPYKNYNITPAQDTLTIRSSPETGQIEYAMLPWGLLPSWSKEAKSQVLSDQRKG